MHQCALLHILSRFLIIAFEVMEDVEPDSCPASANHKFDSISENESLVINIVSITEPDVEITSGAVTENERTIFSRQTAEKSSTDSLDVNDKNGAPDFEIIKGRSFGSDVGFVNDVGYELKEKPKETNSEMDRVEKGDTVEESGKSPLLTVTTNLAANTGSNARTADDLIVVGACLPKASTSTNTSERVTDGLENQLNVTGTDGKNNVDELKSFKNVERNVNRKGSDVNRPQGLISTRDNEEMEKKMTKEANFQVLETEKRPSSNIGHSLLTSYLTNFTGKKRNSSCTVDSDKEPTKESTSLNDSKSSVAHQHKTISSKPSSFVPPFPLVHDLTTTTSVGVDNSSLPLFPPNKSIEDVSLRKSSSSVQISSQVNKRKRNTPQHFIDISQIPVHVKDEIVDDAYESSSSKVRILGDDSRGLKMSRGEEQESGTPVPKAIRLPNGNADMWKQSQLTTSPSLASNPAETATSLKVTQQRTVPSYRFATFKVPPIRQVTLPNTGIRNTFTIPSMKFSNVIPASKSTFPKKTITLPGIGQKNCLILPSGEVYNMHGSSPVQITAGTSRTGSGVLLGCRPSMPTSQVSVSNKHRSGNSGANTASAVPLRFQNALSPNANSGTSVPKISMPNSSLVIVVNRPKSITSKPGAVNSSSQTGASLLINSFQVSEPTSLQKSSSVIASLVTGSDSRLSKVRSSNTRADLLTRKFQAFYEKSVMAKFVSPQVAPESLQLDTPLERFICEGCGDEFVTKLGLKDHYERKSIVVSFTCRCDKKTHVFYNMCSFTRFYKEHWKRVGETQETLHSWHDSCVIDMLPPFLMPKQYIDLKSAECEDSLRKQRQEESSSEGNLTASRSQAGSSDTQTLSSVNNIDDGIQHLLQIASMDKFFVALEQHNTKCLECSFVFKKRKGLSTHFSAYRVHANSNLFQCGKCFMVLPNRCSFQAHSRIHDKVEPYVCPECGLLFTTSREIFMKHVKQVCLHFSRFLSHQCPICKSLLSYSVQKMVTHLDQEHATIYHKCDGCTMAFPSEKSFNNHNIFQHRSAAGSKTIRECPICHIVETESISFIEHLTQHINKEGFEASYAFRCLACKINFARRASLIDHMKDQHANEMVTRNMCEVCGMVCENASALYGHIHTQHEEFSQKLFSKDANGSTPNLKSLDGTDNVVQVETEAKVVKDGDSEKKSFKCDRCQMVFTDGAQHKRHLAKHQFVESKRAASSKLSSEPKQKKQRTSDVTDEVTDTKAEENQPPANTHVNEVKESASVPPVQPSEDDKDTVSCWFSCHLCAKTFKYSENLQKHLKDTHAGKSRQHAYLCWICREQSELKSYPKAGMLVKHMKSVHKIARKNIDYSRIVSCGLKEEKIVSSEGDSTETSTDLTVVEAERQLRVEGDATYNCAKCEFSSAERSAFLEHIQKHRQGEAHLCPECGSCFSVLPSLKRHLFMVHRVRDFERYCSETGFSLELPACEPDTDFNELLLSPSISGSKLKADAESTPENNEQQTTSPEVESNLECTVCYRKFDDQSAVRQHMRVHGMAFIQGTRRNMSRKSLSSDGSNC